MINLMPQVVNRPNWDRSRTSHKPIHKRFRHPRQHRKLLKLRRLRHTTQCQIAATAIWSTQTAAQESRPQANLSRSAARTRSIEARCARLRWTLHRKLKVISRPSLQCIRLMRQTRTLQPSHNATAYKRPCRGQGPPRTSPSHHRQRRRHQRQLNNNSNKRSHHLLPSSTPT